MAKILVTGASGLLGTECCKQLKSPSNEIWAIDNHSRSTSIPECDHWLNLDLYDKELFITQLSTDFVIF